MKLINKISSAIDSIGNLNYSYVIGGSGVYIKRMHICVRRKPGNFGTKQQHRVVLFFLGARGKETERLYKECDIGELESEIRRGIIVPIEDEVPVKLLPNRIPIAKAIQCGNKIALVGAVGKQAVAYIGTALNIRYAPLPTGWINCKGNCINRSSIGWRMHFTLYPTATRIVFTLGMDFRAVTKGELMEILV